jgi:putative transposase
VRSNQSRASCSGPERADSLAVLFRRAHGRYSQYLNTIFCAAGHRTGHLWQQRYFSCPLSKSHHWAALRYVEQNPCRAFMVRLPEQYRWSGAAAHLSEGKDRSRLLDLEYWSKAGRAQTSREMHAAKESADQLQLLRRCTYSGQTVLEKRIL